MGNYESYQEEDLRILEMCHMLHRSSVELANEDNAKAKFLAKNLERYKTRGYVKSKMEEFDKFNEKILDKIKDVFDELQLKYESILKYIALKCGHSHDVK